MSLGWHLVKTAVFYRALFRKIGRHSRIIRPSLLLNTEFAEVGQHVTIGPDARIELIRSREAARAGLPALTIGDWTNIEQNVHIIAKSSVTIGSRVSITGYCAIVDVDHPYRDVSLAIKIGDRIDPVNRPVSIGDGSFIGMFTLILPGTTIGRHCVIGAGSIVKGNIPDYCVAKGRPAVVIRRYDHAKGEWVPQPSPES
jgi:acetyltransferase-like isoleucine patch superfamily enzyme